jgi:hypothetical protein
MHLDGITGQWLLLLHRVLVVVRNVLLRISLFLMSCLHLMKRSKQLSKAARSVSELHRLVSKRIYWKD